MSQYLKIDQRINNVFSCVSCYIIVCLLETGFHSV